MKTKSTNHYLSNLSKLAHANKKSDFGYETGFEANQ